MAQYRIGFAVIDITPPLGTNLAGYASRNDPCTDVYLPLRATATVIDDGTERVLIVAAELISFGDLSPRVRAQIQQVTGIDESRIILSASHTHCGPATREIDDVFDSPRNMAYVDGLVQKLAAVSRQACETMTPGLLRYAVGRCDLAMCRRKPDTAHPPRVLRAMTPYPQGPCDHDVPVLAVCTPAGEVKHVLFSYACHPTSRGDLLVGGDYVGFAMDHIEARRPGLLAGFLQGCGGDQKVRPYDRQSHSFGVRTIAQTRDGGAELGQAVLDVFDRGQWTTIDEPISFSRAVINLVSEPLDEALVNEFLDSKDKWLQMWARMYHEKLDRREAIDRHMPFEIQTLRFGNQLAICTLPAEMTVEYGLRLKRELNGDFKHVLPLAYTNNGIGYVCVKRQRPEYGYEAWDANLYWFRTGRWEEDTEQRIVDAVREGLCGKTGERP